MHPYEMRQFTVCLAVLAVAGVVHSSSFSVGHGDAVSRNGKIKFENVLADSEGSWSSRKSQFKCSDPGYYYITFHGLARKNSGLTLQLVHNNREVVRAHGDGTGYNTASNSAIVYLNWGDKISLRVVDGEIHESNQRDRNYVTLSGFKISGLGDGPQFGEGSPPGTAAAAPSGGSGGTGGAESPPASGAPPAAATDSEGDKEEEFTPLGPDNAGPSR